MPFLYLFIHVSINIRNFNYLIKRDDCSLSLLESEFSKNNECALCFDGKKVSVWKDKNGENQTWSVDFYLKNFRFRFENEHETRYLQSEDELNKWLTFRFLTIRDNINPKQVSELRKAISKYSIDKEYLIDLYNRWLDNSSEQPQGRCPILEQLVDQSYDYIFGNDSGNRVFSMIMSLPSEKRKLYLGRK